MVKAHFCALLLSECQYCSQIFFAIIANSSNSGDMHLNLIASSVSYLVSQSLCASIFHLSIGIEIVSSDCFEN